MSNLFTPATREKAKLRMALQGVSGGGKTLSALYLAFGMTGDWSKVALIDTEHERAKEYATRSDLPTPTGAFLYAHLAHRCRSRWPGRRSHCGQPFPRLEWRGRCAGI